MLNMRNLGSRVRTLLAKVPAEPPLKITFVIVQPVLDGDNRLVGRRVVGEITADGTEVQP